MSFNQKQKKDFDNLWRQRIENSKYNFEENPFSEFSSRKTKVWDKYLLYNIKKVKPKLVFWQKIKTELETIREPIIATLIVKPSYIDYRGKVRHWGNYGRDWFLWLELENWEKIPASLNNIFKKI